MRLLQFSLALDWSSRLVEHVGFATGLTFPASKVSENRN